MEGYIDKKSNRIRNPFAFELYSWGESALFAIVFVILLFTFLFRTATVDGPSMIPTLQDKEMLVISNLFFKPKTGDIIVLDSNVEALNEALVKRVIATEGQTVDINAESGTVKVDGKELMESYIAETTRTLGDQTYPLTVPKGTVFVMGDNRNISEDSRYKEVGFIDSRYVLGRVLLRFFPMNKLGVVQ